jgi:hypothetical protein
MSGKFGFNGSKVDNYRSFVPLAAGVARQERRWWLATVAYGVVALALVHAPLAAARVPLAGALVPVHRFHGIRDRVLPLADEVAAFRDKTHGRGVLVATGHNEAGLLAYYLPGRPVVASAGRLFGLRPSAYDFFPATDLRNPSIAGRPALFLSGDRALPMVVPAID